MHRDLLRQIKTLDWRPFYELFSSTLNSRGRHLNDNEKTCLLLKAMKDEDARQVVLLHSQGEGGYTKAVDINNYGSPTIVFPHHVRRTMVRETVDFSKDGFTNLRHLFLLPYQAMKEMKLATLSQYLAALLAFEDFTPRMREEWTKHIASMSDLPTLEDLFAFTEPLEYKMVARVEASSVNFTDKPSTSRKSSSTCSNVTSKSTTNQSQCGLCNEYHKRPVFLSYEMSRRLKYVKEHKGCTNCPNSSHTCSNCPWVLHNSTILYSYIYLSSLQFTSCCGWGFTKTQKGFLSTIFLCLDRLKLWLLGWDYSF